jgi:hypothetical protein
MKDIVIIPTYSRPEMLWLCLEHLAKCPEISGMDVRIYVDAHDAVRTAPPVPEINEVLARFPHLPLTVNWRTRHRYDGNTFNVMTAYAEAHTTDAEFVYLVEDDVMVRPDFFAWHRGAQAAGQWFCSIASRFLKQGGRLHDDGYIVDNRYASIGVCFKRENLAPIVEHAHQHYFGNMSGYLNTVFKDGRADQFTEQDGLITRVMERGRLLSIWPTNEPRAFHQGFYGYHRWNCPRPQGTLEQRYEYVKRVSRDPAALKALSKNVNDVEAVPCD